MGQDRGEPQLAVRVVRAEEWRAVRELRLLALRDPVAGIAFLDSYEDAVAKPDAFWRERAERSSGGPPVRQFVAEGQDGEWGGTVTVVIEEAGGRDVFGETVARRQAHLVGVFVRPEWRGTGAVDALFEAAASWARTDAGASRLRLYVHEDNARAERFYRRFGFVPSGVTIPMKGDPTKRERELVLDPADPAATPALTLGDVLRDPSRLRFGDALYMDRAQELALGSECLVWDVDDVPDEGADLPEPATARGFDYVLDGQTVLSIVENTRAQRPRASTEDLFRAFSYYWRNDAFLVWPPEK